MDQQTNRKKHMKIKSKQVIHASEVEEFFWAENDEPVAEGFPVGIETEYSDRFELVLFDDIYWSDKYLV